MRGSLLTIVIACVVSCVPAFAAPANGGEPARYDLKIESQPLGKALQEFAKQSGVQVIFFSRVTEGHEAPSLEGRFTAAAALQHLLNDSQLTFRELNARTIEVHPKAAVNMLGTSRAQSPDVATLEALGVTASAMGTESSASLLAQVDAQTQSETDSEESTPSARNARDTTFADLGEVVVTGTNIRGVYPASSPVQIYTAEDIARSGATTTEQFIQKLPQNLGTRTEIASGAVGVGSRINQDSAAGVDLRGLGIGTTLVLLNGRRLGQSDFGRTTDIAMIPASAIERVEVLTDGASAIYGSDAIGGVVNFILRDAFQGAETRLSYGAVSDGGLHQTNATQTLGHNWSSGNGLLSYNFFDAMPLDVADRDYAATADRGTLTSDDRRHNLLLTVSQDIGQRLNLSGDLALARREVGSDNATVNGANPLNWTLTTTQVETEQLFANVALDYDLTAALHGKVAASYSEADVSMHRVNRLYRQTPPSVTSDLTNDRSHSVLDMTASLGGNLFALQGGTVRFSLGAGYLDEEYTGATFDPTANPGARLLARGTSYAFGELFLPLASPEQDIPFVKRLELNLAVRYTDYRDKSSPALNREFGDAVDPKVGVLWSPFESLSLRATYGTSFRAPSLSEIDKTGAVSLLLAGIGIPFPNGPASIRVLTSGPAPDLDPEVAETFTIGFDFRPDSRAGLLFSATYYNISYEDRIGQAPAPVPTYLQMPGSFPSTIYNPPSAEFIEEILEGTTITFNNTGIPLTDLQAAAQTLFNGPNTWIVDLRTRNLSLSEQDGFDLSVLDRFNTGWGEVRYGGNVTYILDYKQQAAPESAVVTVLNTVAQPVGLRGRTYAGISRGGFDGTLSLNYVDDYANPFASAGVDSWTTTDLSMTYAFDEGTSSFLDGVRLFFSVQNLFDEDPPFVAGGSTVALFNPIGFDPTNANPLGRFVTAGITKAW